MDREIIIHLEAPKCASTYLQAILFSNSENLRRHGFWIPGRRRADHVRIARAALAGRNGPKWGRVEKFLNDVNDSEYKVILSDEFFFKGFDADAVDVMMKEFHQVADIRFVMVARDLVDQVPSAWQEELKMGRSLHIDDFARNMDANTAGWTWHNLDPATILQRTTRTLEVEKIHVVTMPPRSAGNSLLWTRFASACGLDPEICDLNVDFARESLGVEAATLLYRLGPKLQKVALERGAGRKDINRWVKRYLSHEILARHRGRRIGMSAESIVEWRIGLVGTSGPASWY